MLGHRDTRHVPKYLPFHLNPLPSSANSMRLLMFPRKTMLLPLKLLIHLLMFPRLRPMSFHMLFVSLKPMIRHFTQLVNSHLQIGDESIASRAREIFPYDDAHEFHPFAVRRHGVRWYDPASFTQLVRYGEFVEFVAVFGVEAEGYEGEAAAARLG